MKTQILALVGGLATLQVNASYDSMDCKFPRYYDYDLGRCVHPFAKFTQRYRRAEERMANHWKQKMQKVKKMMSWFFKNLARKARGRRQRGQQKQRRIKWGFMRPVTFKRYWGKNNDSPCQCYANGQENEGFCEGHGFTVTDCLGQKMEGRCHWGPEECPRCAREGHYARMKMGDNTEDFSSSEDLDVPESEGDEDPNEMEELDVPPSADEVDPEEIDEPEDNSEFDEIEDLPENLDNDGEIEDPDDVEGLEDVSDVEDPTEEPETPSIILPPSTTPDSKQPTGPEFDPNKLKITRVIEPIPFSSDNEEDEDENIESVEAEVVPTEPEDAADADISTEPVEPETAEELDGLSEEDEAEIAALAEEASFDELPDDDEQEDPALLLEGMWDGY